jgi:ubiquinone/menaquinone biosynthesis C-methylase UbiE
VTTSAPSPVTLPTTWDLVASAYAQEIVPVFELYAADALERVQPAQTARVVDVATGPGTLAMLAARRVAHVDALDFSPEMLARLRARLTADGTHNVIVHQGDGMALPFADASYDAAFSMFGLFMFADRARGFAELHRVLKPGCRAAVTSWQPFDRVPMIKGLFAILKELMPELPFGDSAAPLGDRDTFAAEMSAAGFRDVAVCELVHAFRAPSTEEYVASMERTCAPMALLVRKLGPNWAPVRARLSAVMTERAGAGPHEVAMPAWLGVGTR